MAGHSRKKVVIIGAGAAGMAAADLLANHPDRFEVTIMERAPYAGGQATSEDIDSAKFGASFINDGVQGGSNIFRHTEACFQKVLGKEEGALQEVGLQIAFGKGETFWTNVFPTDLVLRHSGDIKKFGRVIKTIKRFEVVLGLIPLHVLLPMFRFSPEFQNMVYQLIALFLGTGNATPYVASAILAHLFLDENVKLFDYDPKTLLAMIPSMYAFPELRKVYARWVDQLKEKGVDVRLGHEVINIQRSKADVQITSRDVIVDVYGREKATQKAESSVEGRWHEIILACDAEACLKLLDKGATFMEKKVLGNVVYKDDISVTHHDLEYMREHYETEWDPKLKASIEPEKMDEETKKAFDFAEKAFDPLYFTRSYPSDPKSIEMSFDLSVYQPQFPHKKDALSKTNSTLPMDQRLYQTIFLDNERNHLWSRDKIDKDKIVLEKWWHQLAHRWQHFAFTVPFMMWLQSPEKRHTQYAGSWLVVNMHEGAIISGMAAAWRLGAHYPHEDNAEMKKQFVALMALQHGTFFTAKKNATRA